MKHWKTMLVAAAAPLLLSGCLWGPGKFASDLTIKRDGSFALNYRGEIVLQIPDESRSPPPREAWSSEMVRCYENGQIEENWKAINGAPSDRDTWKTRPCTSSELAKAHRDYDKDGAEEAEQQRRSQAEMAKAFGLPGLDDASNRAFAAKLSKYAGYRSVTYRGKGVFDVDYHFEGRATQDFVFPALPDNNLIIPFIALRRRSDGSVLVTAPAFTGGSGPMSAAMAGAGDMKGQGPPSRAEGRFTVITDGEILTNNSEDGAAPHALGRQVHWDVGPGSSKIPETLIRLQ